MFDFQSKNNLPGARTPVSDAHPSATDQTSSPKIPCRRCLIEGLDETEVLAKLQEYIDAIEPTRRTPDDVYRFRLSVCEDCPQLTNGMCRLCGCFVLYRAATAGNCCPDTPGRW